MSEPGVIAFGPCLVCRRPFVFNPELVPSHPWPIPDGPRAPICERCVTRINAERRAGGRPEWEIPPGAYEAGPA